jgi:hypothetical protein
MPTAKLKDFEVLPTDPKVPSRGFRLKGQAFGYENARDGTRLETGNIIGRNKEGTQFIAEGSNRVWEVEGNPRDNTGGTGLSPAETNEFIGKMKFVEFSVDNAGRAKIAPARKNAETGAPLTPEETEKAAEDDPTSESKATELRKSATMTSVVENGQETDPTTGQPVIEVVSAASPMGATNVPATLARAPGIAIEPPQHTQSETVPTTTAPGQDPTPSDAELQSQRDRAKGLSPSITTASSQSLSTPHAAQPPVAGEGGPGNTSAGGGDPTSPSNGAATTAPVSVQTTPVPTATPSKPTAATPKRR